MKKMLFLILLFPVFLLCSCSNNNTKNDIVVINGENSNVKELNNIYNSKTEDDYFFNLYVLENNNGIIRYAIKWTDSDYGEAILNFKSDEKTIYSNRTSEYIIKTSDSTINPNELEKNDVLICYSNNIAETDPCFVCVNSLYYLGYKTETIIEI